MLRYSLTPSNATKRQRALATQRKGRDAARTEWLEVSLSTRLPLPHGASFCCHAWLRDLDLADHRQLLDRRAVEPLPYARTVRVVPERDDLDQPHARVVLVHPRQFDRVLARLPGMALDAIGIEVEHAIAELAGEVDILRAAVIPLVVVVLVPAVALEFEAQPAAMAVEQLTIRSKVGIRALPGAKVAGKNLQTEIGSCRHRYLSLRQRAFTVRIASTSRTDRRGRDPRSPTRF